MERQVNQQAATRQWTRRKISNLKAATLARYMVISVGFGDWAQE